MRIGFRQSVEAAKQAFFDREKVTKAMDAATRKSLSKFGAFVRTRAKSSIRKRKKASEPGKPPSSHDQQLLKKFIYFSYDDSAKSVVIGPVKLNLVSIDNDGRPIRGTVPQVLERGGQIGVIEEWTGKRWKRRDLRRKGAGAAIEALRTKSNVFDPFQNRPIRKRTVNIAARPYMRPAFDTELKKAPDLWAGAMPQSIAA